MAQSQAQGEQNETNQNAHGNVGSNRVDNNPPALRGSDDDTLWTNGRAGSDSGALKEQDETQIDRRTGSQVAANHALPDNCGDVNNRSNQTGGVNSETSKNDRRAPLYDRTTRLRAVAGANFRVAKPLGLAARRGKIDGAGEVDTASTSTGDFASTSKPAEVPILSTLFGIAEEPVWRPKKFTRNAKYPGVSATGFYFQDHSGGFVLIHRASSKYDSFYTKAAIKELEAKYGKAKRSPKPATRRRSSDG